MPLGGNRTLQVRIPYSCRGHTVSSRRTDGRCAALCKNGNIAVGDRLIGNRKSREFLDPKFNHNVRHGRRAHRRNRRSAKNLSLVPPHQKDFNSRAVRPRYADSASCAVDRRNERRDAASISAAGTEGSEAQREHAERVGQVIPSKRWCRSGSGAAGAIFAQIRVKATLCTLCLPFCAPYDCRECGCRFLAVSPGPPRNCMGVYSRVRWNPAPAAMTKLRDLHRTANALAECTLDILEHPAVARAIEEELLRALANEP
jgi:hypothetical protein